MNSNKVKTISFADCPGACTAVGVMAGLAGPVWARAVRCAAQSSAPLALRQGCAVAFAQRGHARAAHRAAAQSHTAVRARGGLIRDACGGGAPQLAMAVTRARSTQAAGDSASDSPYFAWHPSEHHGLKVHPQSVTHSTTVLHVRAHSHLDPSLWSQSRVACAPSGACCCWHYR